MVCGRMGGLTKRQREICRATPETMLAISDGIRIAMDECHRQFSNHRWNCSSINFKYPMGYLITVGSREAALTYAMVSGGVAYAVARACARGELRSCGCQVTNSEMSGQSSNGKTSTDKPSKRAAGASWKWRGCGVDVDFGVKMARRFLDAREIESDARSQMNLHNNKAGRMAVKNNMVQSCKCHGMSGSCSMKTCWKGLPHIQRIGNYLMDKYYRARRTRWSRSSGLRTARRNLKPRGSDLIYLDASPNYCQANSQLGTLGTKGRTCNKSTTTDLASCNVLCCGRGYNTHQYFKPTRCNCKFHWCCYVECQTCNELVQIHTCK
ncbi:unnamed protein product [Nesidiocoris tenuis]|uniref:Protein Wnt n=1 Tax=Nesidiocoris tenuis TaxID=355587 RepID=A0A6H5GMK1_9HEMI|nr:unnamed protein product [Nesidiocoris tenuis]CAB0003537.1 unnamed protein product [Nesidiocoris tenuis]